eukprot:GABV01001700.1.p1 GENE.GABV01001700.1~~GABV01001700.1.p1  ORF type:complete len:203 (-),score=43.37 GABV01001700.1:64-672(-)
MQAVTNEPLPGPDLHTALKSGVYLCQLINTIAPGSVSSVNLSPMPFPQRENLTHFLNACIQLGMRQQNLFVVQDLYEGDNLVAVINTIYQLALLSRSIPSFNGPYMAAGDAFETSGALKAGRAQLSGGSSAAKAVPRPPSMPPPADLVAKHAHQNMINASAMEHAEATKRKSAKSSHSPAAAPAAAPSPPASQPKKIVVWFF